MLTGPGTPFPRRQLGALEKQVGVWSVGLSSVQGPKAPLATLSGCFFLPLRRVLNFPVAPNTAKAYVSSHIYRLETASGKKNK